MSYSNQFPTLSGRRLTYSDPYRTIARFPSICKCGNKIKQGDSIVYDKRNKKAYCINCGGPILDNIRAENSMDQYGTDIF